MATTQKLNLPPFFVRNSDGDEADSGNEAVQDFFLAWTLRCASNKYQNKNSNLKLYEFSRRIVYALLYGEHDEKGNYILPNTIEGHQIPTDFQILSVKTFRQIQYIDLYAEVEIINGEKYIINIEDKFYSTIKEKQLSNARNILEAKYAGKAYKIINLVIYCDQTIICNDNSRQEICKKYGYKFPDLETLRKLVWDNTIDGEETGNDLFDEFWFSGAFRPQ